MGSKNRKRAQETGMVWRDGRLIPESKVKRSIAIDKDPQVDTPLASAFLQYINALFSNPFRRNRRKK